jgi:hypothetical protein
MTRVTDRPRVETFLRPAVTRPCSLCGRELLPDAIVAASNRGLLCLDCNVSRGRPAMKPTPCLCCGRPVIRFAYVKPNRRGRPFCCGACSTRWYQATERYFDRKHWPPGRRLKKPAKQAKPKCAECRKSFIPTRSDARYCSAACKQRAYRQRH